MKTPALPLSAVLTVTPAAAGGGGLAPGVTLHTTVYGEGTGHNTWTATVQVQA
ncbi:hypothetical protein OHS18_43340 [Amycolatopsis sp. NBC_00355]|uniref:hypothetical protein n=1 Tax=Amycolatopsis sp. NBC_00355 TaxID=2975957 RepID=UPI002E2641CF